MPEISVMSKPEQDKPSQKKHSILQKKRTKSDYSSKLSFLPSAGRIIQHKVNCPELKIDPKIPSKSFKREF